VTEPDLERRTLDVLVARAAERVTVPTRGADEAVGRAGRLKRARWIVGALLSLVAASALAVPLVVLSALGEGSPDGTGTTPRAGSSPSVGSPISPPEGPGPFHGKPHREGGSLIMPITFPDGTMAELVYPATLELGTSYVHPGAFVRQRPKPCHPEVYFSRSEIVGNWTSPDPPLAVFEGIHGDPVALWSGKRWLQPRDVLAFDFGDWVAMVVCQADPQVDADALSTFARSLDGHQTPDGFFVLTPRPPVRLVEEGFQVGPRVTLEKDRPFQLVELTLSGCSPSAAVIVQRSTVDGCFQGGIALYAQGNPDFLRAVSEGLRVRDVRPPPRMS
jgi:hypothetical protein